MSFTPRQEEMIAAFLRESVQAVRGLPADARAQALAQIKRRLKSELKQAVDKGNINDESLQALLSSMPASSTGWQPPADTPEDDASERSAPARRSFGTRKHDDAVWLGVCAGLARQTRTEVRMIRWAFVIPGFVLGPVALMAYLSLYAEMVLNNRLELPDDARNRILSYISRTAAIATALFVFGYGSLWGMSYGFQMLYGKPLILSQWGWVNDYHFRFLSLSLFCLLPIEVLGALTDDEKWKEIFRRAIHVGLLIYGVALSFGVAAALTGTLLRIVNEISG